MTATWSGTGVNQDPGQGADYPFARPSLDVQYLLGDLWLGYVDDYSCLVPPLAVTRLAGFDLAYPARREIKISDANGKTVFNSATAAYASSLFGNNLEVMQWTTAGTTGAILRATRHIAPPAYAPSQTYAHDFAPASGVLSARATMRLPRRVRSISVGNIKLSGGIVLAEGYNLGLAAATASSVDGGRLTQSVTLTANPGDGQGLVPGCQNTATPIYRINSVPPDASGNLTLDADQCYRIQRPVAVTGPGTAVLVNSSAVQLSNDCTPCCKCQDYVNTYKGLTNLWNSYQTLGRQAEAVRDQLVANLDRWNAQAACRAAQPLKLVLNAESGSVLFVGGLHCNQSGFCLQPVVLRVTVEAFPGPGNAAVLCRETVRNGSDTNSQDTPYVPAGAYPVYDTYFDYANPGASSRFRTRLAMDLAGSGAARVTLSVHIPDTYNASGDAAPLPDPDTVSVPSPVLALWEANPPPSPVRALLTRMAPVSPTAGCGSCL